MFFFKITLAFPKLNYVSKSFLPFLHFENKMIDNQQLWQNKYLWIS